MQKKANLHFSLTLDLFGNEISTNAANAFNAGLKGRYREDKLTDDHQLLSDDLSGAAAEGRRDRAGGRAGAVRAEHAAARRLRGGCRRWGGALEPRAGAGRASRSASRLPHVAFNRRIGEFAAIHADTDGNVMAERRVAGAARRRCCRPRTTTVR